MKAMILERVRSLSESADPLVHREVPEPAPGPGEILIRVAACGVCHTDLDVIEGRTPPAHLPLVPGHQVVGRVEACGAGAMRFARGDRVGVAWIGSACGRCGRCREGRENLCPEFRGTGRDLDGGYAAYMVAREDFATLIPGQLRDEEAAPLLCAGAIGWRALGLTGMEDGWALGLTGFGASGHLVLKMVRKRFPRARVYVFTRTETEQAFARELGADWAGAIDEAPPEPLDAAIDTTPAWQPVVSTLGHLAPGGRLVVNAIRKEEGDKNALLELDWLRDLWLEKEIVSVANVTRRDVGEFLAFAAEAGVRPHVEEYPLAEANRALRDLKERRIRGAKVLRL
jgi:propanol-preferring alcohol dehydrogenase